MPVEPLVEPEPVEPVEPVEPLVEPVEPDVELGLDVPLVLVSDEVLPVEPDVEEPVLPIEPLVLPVLEGDVALLLLSLEPLVLEPLVPEVEPLVVGAGEVELPLVLEGDDVELLVLDGEVELLLPLVLDGEVELVLLLPVEPVVITSMRCTFMASPVPEKLARTWSPSLMSFSDAREPSFVTSVLESTLRVFPESVRVLLERSKLSIWPVSSLPCELVDDAMAPLVSLLEVPLGDVDAVEPVDDDVSVELVEDDVLLGDDVLLDVLLGDVEAVESLLVDDDGLVALGDVDDGLVEPIEPLLVSLVFDDAVLLLP